MLGGSGMQDMIRFFILWGPTLLFVFFVLLGILTGVLRGFRKSAILFVHMLLAGVICLCIYIGMTKNPNLDGEMVKVSNGILGNFGSSLQDLLQVDEKCETLHQMIMELITNSMEKDKLEYYLVIDNAAYISTLVEMVYRFVLAILAYILYAVLLFLFYIIYLIFYPVRRKIKQQNKKFQRGEVSSPYKPRRLLGGVVGGVRSVIVGVISFSFLGTLIFIVSGGTNLPSRSDLKDGDQVVEFSDPVYNEVYDYYSYICEMGNTGIFQVLNNIKDSNHTPFYFYFADLVLQGNIQDETMGINEKLYLRDEAGYYIAFCKKTLTLVLKYADAETIDQILKGQQDANALLNGIFKAMEQPGFSEEFSDMIENFEARPFITNLCLSSLTSLVNHIELATDDETVIALVNELFKGEDSIKVTDLATEEDVRNLFLGIVDVIAAGNSDSNDSVEGQEIFNTKSTIRYAQALLPTIEGLSLFESRKDTGNKILSGLYRFCSTNLVTEDMELPQIPDTIVWVDEFKLLLEACDPLLNITYQIYDEDNEKLIDNFLYLFTGAQAAEMEIEYDHLADILKKSNLLDVVFKSSLVGNQIDNMLMSMTGNEEASIPKNITYIGDNGECQVLLKCFKIFLKNDGADLYYNMIETEEITSETFLSIFNTLTRDVTPDDPADDTTLLKELLKSKLLHYIISTYLSYSTFGKFEIYMPNDSVESITEGTGDGQKTYRILKHSEIEFITDMIVNCSDVFAEIIDQPEHIDYAKLLSNPYILDTFKQSLLLQGTLANIIIHVSQDEKTIILPLGYDDPEMWLSHQDTTGEIEYLIEAVGKLAKVEDENGEALINALLNGSLSANTLLNLENSILYDICSSRVLRYTVSDMITDLGSSNFAVVVAYKSLEEVNAPTTEAAKYVNVVQTEELYDIFTQLKQYICFGENDEVKIRYNQIFENKEQICRNLTISATLIQQLLGYATEEKNYLVVPTVFKEHFEKIKTTDNLTGNVWFGTSDSPLDDELYLMFTALENSIEKDESGNIPEDFDIAETMNTTLKIQRESMEAISSSTIINASLTRRIVEMFDTPAEVYQDETLTKEEINYFFDALFSFFDSHTIIVDELNQAIADFEITQQTLVTILKSKIMQTTISKNLMDTELLSIPEIVLKECTLYDGTMISRIESEELDCLFDSIFATTEGSISASRFDLTNINLPKTKLKADQLTKSLIVSATLSDKIMELNTNEKIIIPDESFQFYSFQGGLTADPYILQSELSNLVLALTVGMKIEDINNLSIETLLIPQTDEEKTAVVNSEIMRATISKAVLNQEKVSIAKDSVCLDTSKQYQHQSIGILSEQEILSIIEGFEKLGTGDFNDISFEIRDILLAENSVDLLYAIAASEVYRSIISATLGEERTYQTLTLQNYELFWAAQESILIEVDGVPLTYYYQQKDLGILLGSHYLIQYPKIPIKTYDSFTLEEKDGYLCSKADILALQGIVLV